jgi:hypothetical protein
VFTSAHNSIVINGDMLKKVEAKAEYKNQGKKNEAFSLLSRPSAKALFIQQSRLFLFAFFSPISLQVAFSFESPDSVTYPPNFWAKQKETLHLKPAHYTPFFLQ